MGKRTEEIIVARGHWGKVVCAITSNRVSPSEKFLRKLEKFRRKDYARVIVLFQRLAGKGKIINEEQFKHLTGKIYEFKRHQIRVGCFQQGRTWILTHGFIKKQQKWPKREIERAIRIMEEHVSRGN